MAEGGYYVNQPDVNDGNQQQQRKIIKEKHVVKKDGNKTKESRIITYDDGTKREEYSTEVKPSRRRNKLFNFPLGLKLPKSEPYTPAFVSPSTKNLQDDPYEIIENTFTDHKDFRTKEDCYRSGQAVCLRPPAKAAAVTKLPSAFTGPSSLSPPPRLPPRNEVSTTPKIIDSEPPEGPKSDDEYECISNAKEDLAEVSYPPGIHDIYDDRGIPMHSPSGTPPNDNTNQMPHELKAADLDTSTQQERRNSLPLPRKNTCKDKTLMRPVSTSDLKSSDRPQTDTNEDKDAAYDYLEAMRNNLKRMSIIKEVDDSHSYDTTPDMLNETENRTLAKEEPLFFTMDMTETNDGEYENFHTYETPDSELGPDQEVYV